MNLKKITEIDISKQARALGWFRLTDALVVPSGKLHPAINSFKFPVLAATFPVPL